MWGSLHLPVADTLDPRMGYSYGLEARSREIKAAEAFFGVSVDYLGGSEGLKNGAGISEESLTACLTD